MATVRPTAPAEGMAWTLQKGMLASLYLHALFVLPFLLMRLWPVETPVVQDKLVVELFGMVTNQQMAESQAGEPIMQSPAVPQEAPAPPPRRRAEARPVAAVQSPVKERTLPPAPEAPTPPRPEPSADEVARSEEPAETAPSAPPSPEVATPVGTGPQQQARQTIQHDLQAQRRYMTALAKAIKAGLTYPAQARGATGMVVIAFRLHADGSVEPGSLLVRKSSGHAILDEQALLAVRSAMPFEPPPKPMSIALDIPFSDSTP